MRRSPRGGVRTRQDPPDRRRRQAAYRGGHIVSARRSAAKRRSRFRSNIGDARQHRADDVETAAGWGTATGPRVFGGQAECIGEPCRVAKNSVPARCGRSISRYSPSFGQAEHAGNLLTRKPGSSPASSGSNARTCVPTIWAMTPPRLISRPAPEQATPAAAGKSPFVSWRVFWRKFVSAGLPAPSDD